MLSKEQIDRLEVLAAKATKTEWSDDGWNGICAASDQLNGGYFVCTCEGPDRRNNMDYISAANPAVVLELIAMLRESESKANAAVKALAKMVMECYPVTEEQAIAAVEKSLPRDCDGSHHERGNQ